MQKFSTKIFSVLIITILLSSCFFFSSCKKEEDFTPYICELKLDVYASNTDEVNLKAHYGFNDNENANSTTHVYGLYFYLTGVEEDNITRTVTLRHGDKTLVETFHLNPVTDRITAFMEIKNFNEKSFSVTLNEGSTKHEITLSSTLPEKTLTYKNALSALKKEQGALLDSYKNADGEFNAKLIMRVLVKDNKPYWYVGIKKDDGLKAFLLDGITGKTLAVREVF